MTLDDTRFSRTGLLLGPEALIRLRQAHVVICGLGAVGSYAAEALARSGVGHLRLVDFDVIRPSNINRQLFALESTLGRPKAEVARERLRDINPGCRIEALQVFIDSQSIGQVLAGPPAVLIDAIDSLGPKVFLIASTVEARIPILSSMGAATRTDPLAIRTGDLFDTTICPLARFLRRKLRKRGINSGVRCVYSLEPPRRHAATTEESGADEAPSEPETYLRGRVRRPLGSLSMITGMFGLVAAREALGILLGLPAGGAPDSLS